MQAVLLWFPKPLAALCIAAHAACSARSAAQLSHLAHRAGQLPGVECGPQALHLLPSQRVLVPPQVAQHKGEVLVSGADAHRCQQLQVVGQQAQIAPQLLQWGGWQESSGCSARKGGQPQNVGQEAPAALPRVCPHITMALLAPAARQKKVLPRTIQPGATNVDDSGPPSTPKRRAARPHLLRRVLHSHNAFRLHPLLPQQVSDGAAHRR